MNNKYINAAAVLAGGVAALLVFGIVIGNRDLKVEQL